DKKERAKPKANGSTPKAYPTCLRARAVSGMLSNTPDTKPRPSAVCHEAPGNLSTGIKVAHSTSDNKKILPFIAAGTISQSGRRTTTLIKTAQATDSQKKGKL